MSDTAREWTGDGICCGPKARPQPASAALKALELVRGLDVRLDALRPAHNEVAPGSELGLAWMSLLGCVARCELRVDELIEVAAPIKPSRREFVRRPPASG